MTEGKIEDIPLYNQDLDGQSETANSLATLIKDSDGVLFFSPEYNYSIPGVLRKSEELTWRIDGITTTIMRDTVRQATAFLIKYQGIIT